MSKIDEIKGKNRVYFAETDPDYGGVYIADRTLKDAKAVALTTFVADHMESYIDLRVKWIKGIETDYEGELDIKQINDLGLAWWSCEECDGEDFEIINGGTYKCKECGKIFDVPYVN